MHRRNNLLKLLVVLGGSCCVMPAAAAVLDNFNGYTVGTVGTGATGGVWTAIGADSGTMQNESGNLLMSIGSASTNSGTFRALPSNIPDATAATTIFMRLRANAATVNTSLGVSDVLAPTSADDFGVFEPQMRMINTAGADVRFEARNGGAFTSLNTPITLGQWYNVWMVINTSTDTWDAYINTGTANATAGDLKLANIGFRNGVAANPLTTLLVYGGAGGVLAGSIDDININSGLNLTNFTPATLIPGDTDGNGTVQYPQDFNPIRDNFQKSVALRTQGDLNRDGIVEFADFREWKAAFLAGGGSLEGIDLSFATVPEPSSACLLVLVASMLGIGSRHCRPEPRRSGC
jgi:hypothetical protein